MFRNVCLAITLAAFAAASAHATPVTRTHKRAPALVPVRKQSHSASSKSGAGKTITSKSVTNKPRRYGSTTAGQASSHRPAGRSTATTGSARNRPVPRSAPPSETRTSLRYTKVHTERIGRSPSKAHYVPAVRRQWRIPERQPVAEEATPQPNVEIASLDTDAGIPLPSVSRTTPRTGLRSAPRIASSKVEPWVTAMPAPLKGSLESLARQNEKTDKDDLERILDEDDLKDRIANKVLVPIPASASLTVNNNLPETHRYCRPWTATFLSDLAQAHAERFEEPLKVTSAVRTVDYQKQLMQVNGNATQAEGDIVSPHLTGATIDIGKGAMSRAELAWMRNYLEKLQLEGKIDVEEEFHQACFHITVYRSYVPPASPAEPAVQARKAHHKTGSLQVASQEQPQE
jgi:Family of unknown function (DUF5715)